MDELLNIFSPYFSFISFFVIIIINLIIIFKGLSFLNILIANILVMIILEFLGLEPFNFIGSILEMILNFIFSIFEGIFRSIGDLIGKAITPWRDWRDPFADNFDWLRWTRNWKWPWQ